MAGFYGKGTFHSGKYSGYKAVASLYPEACQIVVRKDSGIDSPDDLEGKTISIGAEESGTSAMPGRSWRSVGCRMHW